jgi:hypothetical protein
MDRILLRVRYPAEVKPGRVSDTRSLGGGASTVHPFQTASPSHRASEWSGDAKLAHQSLFPHTKIFLRDPRKTDPYQLIDDILCGD